MDYLFFSDPYFCASFESILIVRENGDQLQVADSIIFLCAIEHVAW